MEKKIIFLDVDGTLTLPSGDVSPRVEKAIQLVRKQGHLVFLCTGRSYAGARPLFSIGFDGLICSAGGYIEVQGQKIFESSLDEEDIQLARDVFDRNHVLYNLETNYMTFQDEKMNYEFVRHRVKDGENFNSELQRLLNEQKEHFNIHPLKEYDEHPIPVQKICFVTEDEKNLEEPKKVLQDKFHFIIHEIFSKDVINGEIIIKGTDKGTAVEKVCEYLDMPLSQTIGFGDSKNDYEMIKTCEIGVAMGNASQELKDHADVICESVQNDGIYHELNRLGLCPEIKQ